MNALDKLEARPFAKESIHVGWKPVMRSTRPVRTRAAPAMRGASRCAKDRDAA